MAGSEKLPVKLSLPLVSSILTYSRYMVLIGYRTSSRASFASFAETMSSLSLPAALDCSGS